MKTLVTLTLAALMCPSAHAAEPNGTWMLKSRSCSSGAPVKDAFDDLHGMMSIILANGKSLLVVDAGINQPKWALAGAATVTEGRLRLENMKAVFDPSGIAATGPSESLAITQSGASLIYQGKILGPNGSCPDADTITVEFRKI